MYRKTQWKIPFPCINNFNIKFLIINKLGPNVLNRVPWVLSWVHFTQATWTLPSSRKDTFLPSPITLGAHLSHQGLYGMRGKIKPRKNEPCIEDGHNPPPRWAVYHQVSHIEQQPYPHWNHQHMTNKNIQAVRPFVHSLSWLPQHQVWHWRDGRP